MPRRAPALLSALLLLACATPRRLPRCATSTASTTSSTGGELDDSDQIPVRGAPLAGPPAAPVTIVAFSDFECGFCGRGRVTVADLRAAWPDAIRVVWRNYPLDGHAHARLAAEAAMEAFAQGGDPLFWRFHDVLFSHQARLARADLEGYAALVGMDLPRFRAALDGHAHAAAIDADLALGDRLGVEATPTYFVNGTRITGAQPLALFEPLVRALLARARTLTPARAVYAATVRDPLPVPEPPAPPTPPARGDWSALHAVAVPPGAPSRGGEHAPVVVQEFSDFECPFCGRVEGTLNDLRGIYGERLRLIWRDYPLPRHPRAPAAAEAAREALAQRGSEGFWRYHDLLFAHQNDPGGLDDRALESYAREVGLDLERFRAAMAGHVHAAAVGADVAAANATGLRMGTPAFFINGHFMSGARPLAEFRARIDELLR